MSFFTDIVLTLLHEGTRQAGMIEFLFENESWDKRKIWYIKVI